MVSIRLENRIKYVFYRFFIIIFLSSSAFSSAIYMETFKHPLCDSGDNHGYCGSIKFLDVSVSSSTLDKNKLYSEIFGVFGEVLSANKKYEKKIGLSSPKEEIKPCLGCIAIRFRIGSKLSEKNISLSVDYYGYSHKVSYFLGSYESEEDVHMCLRSEMVRFLAEIYNTTFHSEYGCSVRKEIVKE